MAETLDRISTAIAAALGVATVIAIVATVLVAVFLRFALSAPLVYSYDLSTLLFAWMIFIGLGVAERDGAHLNLDVLRFAVGPQAERAIVVGRQLLIIAIALYMAWIGYRLTVRTGMEITSMRISQRWLYAAMPIGFCLLALSYVLRLPALIAAARRADA